MKMNNTQRIVKEWPENYFPLYFRIAIGNESKYLRKNAVVNVTPSENIIDYFTHEVVETITGDDDCMIKLLAPAGTYHVTATLRDGSFFEVDYVVMDPFASSISKTFRDGQSITFRPGRWDRFILKENSYKLLPIEGVVMDIGAHIGTFTRDALMHENVTKIISYEPDNTNFKFLTMNVTSSKAELIHGAVANKVGTQTLYLNLEGEGGGSGLHSLVRTTSNRAPITVKTYDFREELEKHQPTTLKIDVEGAEQMFSFKDLPSSLLHIAIEFEIKPTMEEQVRDIEAQGFRILKATNGWAKIRIWTRD